VIVRNGATVAVEGDALVLPAGATISSFDDFPLNNLGTNAGNLFLSGLTATTDSGIFVDTTLVIQESNISIAPQFSAGTPYTGWFGAKWNASRQLFMVASVDDPAIATTTDRALVRLQLDPSNALVSETVVSKEGDLIGVDAVVDFGTDPFEFAFNNQGSAMWFADTNAATTADGVILVDGVVLAKEGDPSPIVGRNYMTLSSRPLDLSDGGHTVFRAQLSAPTTDDEVIIRDGAVFMQEGASIPAIGAFQFTSFGTVLRVDSAGRVFWFGDWNDPVLTQDTGIFVNNTLLVQEGVTQVGGLTVTSISSVQDTLTISPDGRYVIFECVLTGPLDAAVMIDLGPNTISSCFGDGTGTGCPCGNNGSIGRGCASSSFLGGAVLTSYGYPGASAGSDTFVITANDIPGPGQFFQGTTVFGGGLGMPFGDGLLCAGGTILRLGVVFPTGTSASFPGGTTPNPIHVGGLTSPGDVRHYQCWYRDAAPFCTVNTYNLTQALTATWGP
jgi:hypothetical protein